MRDEFVKRAVALGCSLRNKVDPGDFPEAKEFAAHVYRVDVPGTPTFDAITIELSDLAGQCGGDYDGWESPVISPKKPN